MVVGLILKLNLFFSLFFVLIYQLFVDFIIKLHHLFRYYNRKTKNPMTFLGAIITSDEFTILILAHGYTPLGLYHRTPHSIGELTKRNQIKLPKNVCIWIPQEIQITILILLLVLLRH